MLAARLLTVRRPYVRAQGFDEDFDFDEVDAFAEELWAQDKTAVPLPLPPPQQQPPPPAPASPSPRWRKRSPACAPRAPRC